MHILNMTKNLMPMFFKSKIFIRVCYKKEILIHEP